MNHRVYFIMIAVTFLWCGFMSAISFMESWLKFKSPRLETATGLSVGRKVFGGLNRVEWAFILIIWVSLMVFRPRLPLVIPAIYGLLNLFLILQSFWLLPLMNKRVDARLRGDVLQPDSYHFWYVGMELLKFVGLLFCGFFLLLILLKM